jgi:hypothetical protein
LTGVPQPEQILNFRPSASSQERLEFLLDKKRESALNFEENRELEQFLVIEHLMRVAKARAKKRLIA